MEDQQRENPRRAGKRLTGESQIVSEAWKEEGATALVMTVRGGEGISRNRCDRIACLGSRLLGASFPQSLAIVRFLERK